MKNSHFIKSILFTAFILIAVFCEAQFPGGQGGPPPGGRPPGGRRPGGRPPGGDREWNMNDNTNIRQKKKVREGDTFTVVGLLRDADNGEYLPYVNVAVLDSIDSAFVKGGITNMDGRFEINEVPQGSFLLRVSAIGYENFMLPFNVTNNTNLGTLRIKQGVTALNEVTVTAEKPIYAMDGEKLVYNVSEDPSIQTGTTEDALQNAPGVEVDVEGNITLRGVSSVEIWVNDKPSKLTEENLKTYLQTLPANAIARIETITNPSAKYATEAEAVINIVTSAHIKSNQFVSFGVNGSNQPFVSPWVSYMWKKEKLSINLFASGRFSDRHNTVDEWLQKRRESTADESIYFITWADTTSQADNNRSISGNLFMNINYEIDSTSDISFDGGGFYNVNRNDLLRSERQTYYYLDSVPPYSMLYADETRSDSDGRRFYGHFGSDYTKKFDNEGHNLRIGFTSGITKNADEQWYNRWYDVYTDLDEHRYMLSSRNTFGMGIDARYNRPYSKDGELSYGLRLDHQQTESSYDRYNDTIGVLIDTLRTYLFKGDETNVSGDVNWTHRWGGFTLSTGLGIGQDRIFYKYDNMWFDDADMRYFWNVRPSVHLTYRTEDMHNWKVNYTMRMAHPQGDEITTFRRYGDNSYSVGNPDGLKNSFTHSIEAGWQKFFERFGNIGLETYGRWSTNEISSLIDAEYDDYLDRIVSYSVPYNMGTSWRYGTSLNMTYRPTGFFNVRLYANLYNYGYRMEYDRVDESGNITHEMNHNDKWSWSVRVNAWAKIFNQYQLTMSANYNSPTISLMSERKARYFLNMGARSDFFKRRLSVFVNVQDIFNWGAKIGSGSSNTNPYFISDSTRKMLNSRYVSAGITLRFGKMELERQAKEGDSETGDTL